MKNRLVCSEDLRLWRKRMLKMGGRKIELDWLLDIGGGLNFNLNQNLKLYENHYELLDMSLSKLEEIWRRYVYENVPLQYLLGKSYWRDFELEINKDVLIPRQETELIIDLACNLFDSKSTGVWADLGTGSGALAIALSRSFPDWEGHAVDISKSALSIAEKNINRLKGCSKVSLHFGNWWKPLKKMWGSFDLVVANPPYIPTTQIMKLQPIVAANEPHLALLGGEDGFNECRKIISGASYGLRKGGWLILEHHYDQSEMAIDLMQKCNLIDLAVKNDLEGVQRFAIGKNPY